MNGHRLSGIAQTGPANNLPKAKVDLGYAYLTRHKTSPIRKPVRHIVIATEDGWQQLCSEQPAIRSHAGAPAQSNCGPCRTTWNRRNAA